MNRKLTLPALASFVAFLGTMLILNQSDGQQPEETSARVALISSAQTSSAIPGLGSEGTKPALPAGPLNPVQAKALVESYTASYTKPWQEYAESPHHLMSRAMPRMIPSLRARVEWASSAEPERMMLATIRISKGLETTAAPCVVDRDTKQVRIFANDQWISAEEWVKTAPQPRGVPGKLPGQE